MATPPSAEWSLYQLYLLFTGGSGTPGTGGSIVDLGWRPVLQENVVANDSDKPFVVPAGKEWHVYSIHVTYASTGSAGNRQLVIRIKNVAGELVGEVRAGIVQAASLTRYYAFAPGLPDMTAFRDTDFLETSIPPTWVIPAGYTIQVLDKAAIAATADDMTVRMIVGERSV